jgi:hypothetical protein
MQSRRMSAIESGVKMIITGTASTLTNFYFVLWMWPPPWTWRDSLEMAAWFGAQSFVLTYLIRRFFNGLR